VTANVPETDLPDLREYLFVDVPRVRMLVSQLRGGAPETTKSVTGRSGRLRASLKLLEGERASQRSEEDTLTLSDLYVSMLEEGTRMLLACSVTFRAGPTSRNSGSEVASVDPWNQACFSGSLRPRG